jgi:hypothetical protein
MQTGPSVDSILKEHQRHIRLEYPDKSVVAELCIDSEHRILFHDTSILATKTRYMFSIVREAIEIEFHPNNMLRDIGLCLSKPRKLLISSLKNPHNIILYFSILLHCIVQWLLQVMFPSV